MLLHLSCMPRLRLQRLSRASSASAASALQRQVDELQGGLIALRGAMDARVVGHDDIKHAVLLGLLSKEHVYIEGPPGVAKTMLAEVIVQAAGLKPWFYQMHRDTRLSELIGDSVIIREPHDGGSGGAGELIRHEYLRGGILTCELCVLDDISRAPGEAHSTGRCDISFLIKMSYSCLHRSVHDSVV